MPASLHVESTIVQKLAATLLAHSQDAESHVRITATKGLRRWSSGIARSIVGRNSQSNRVDNYPESLGVLHVFYLVQ